MTNPREQALARLSVSALAIDAMVVTLCLVGVHKLIVTYLPNSPQWISIVIFPILLILHYLIVEFLAGGISIGRICTGLKIQDENTASKPKLNSSSKCLSSVFVTLGIPSLNPMSLPKYNKREEHCLHSDWVGSVIDKEVPIQPNVTPASNQRVSPRQPSTAARGLKVLQGPHKGETALFKNGKNFSKTGFFIIGRDGKSSDLVLSNDKAVSAVHLRIALKNNTFYILDGKGLSQASTSGTFVNNSQVDTKSPRLLKIGDVIKAGQTIMQVC